MDPFEELYRLLRDDPGRRAALLRALPDPEDPTPMPSDATRVAVERGESSQLDLYGQILDRVSGKDAREALYGSRDESDGPTMRAQETNRLYEALPDPIRGAIIRFRQAVRPPNTGPGRRMASAAELLGITNPLELVEGPGRAAGGVFRRGADELGELLIATRRTPNGVVEERVLRSGDRFITRSGEYVDPYDVHKVDLTTGETTPLSDTRPSGPVDTGQEMLLEHRGPNANELTTIDPEHFGTGPNPGAERRRAEAMGDRFQKRSYFTKAGDDVEESFQGMPVVHSSIDEGHVYDLAMDREHILSEASRRAAEDGLYGENAVMTYAENLARERGYKAIYDGEKVAVFEPLDVQPEFIVAPAMRTNTGVEIPGKPGEVHAMVRNRYPSDLWEGIDDSHSLYLTSRGRYVGRDEAGEIMNAPKAQEVRRRFGQDVPIPDAPALKAENLEAPPTEQQAALERWQALRAKAHRTGRLDDHAEANRAFTEYQTVKARTAGGAVDPTGQLPKAGAAGDNVGVRLTGRDHSVSWGHDTFMFETPDGPLEVIAQQVGDEIRLGWVGRPEHDPYLSTRGPMRPGATAMRQVVDELAKAYPEATSVRYQRIGGARGKAAARAGGDEADDIEHVVKPIPRSARRAEDQLPPGGAAGDNVASNLTGRDRRPLENIVVGRLPTEDWRAVDQFLRDPNPSAEVVDAARGAAERNVRGLGDVSGLDEWDLRYVFRGHRMTDDTAESLADGVPTAGGERPYQVRFQGDDADRGRIDPDRIARVAFRPDPAGDGIVARFVDTDGRVVHFRPEGGRGTYLQHGYRTPEALAEDLGGDLLRAREIFDNARRQQSTLRGRLGTRARSLRDGADAEWQAVDFSPGDLPPGHNRAGDNVGSTLTEDVPPAAPTTADEVVRTARAERDRVAGMEVPTEKARRAAQRAADLDLGFREVPADQFTTAIQSAADTRKGDVKVGDMLTVYSPEEYGEMRTFLSADGKTGYALKSDGDLVSVFNVGQRGGGAAAVVSGIENGATKLDAFEPFLPAFYHELGFRPVRTEANWDLGGDPVTYMEYAGGDRATIRDRIGSFGDYQRPQLEVGTNHPMITSLPNEAEKARAVEELRPPQTPRERIKARRAEYGRSKAGLERLDAEIMEGLSPREQEYFRNADAGTKRRIRNTYLAAPSPRAMASMALAGRDARGWYAVGSAEAGVLRDIFGDEAPRFTALLAALSPQVPVDRNMDLALEVWDAWKRAGMPNDPEDIRALFPRRLDRGGNPYHLPAGAIPSAESGMLRALTATEDELLDPMVLDAVFPPGKGGDLLDGTKTNNFYANLMGNVQRLTLDTHMLGGGGGMNSATIARQLGYGAAVRNGARDVQRLTGGRINPSEAQEMIWAPVRWARENSSAANPAADLLRDPNAMARMQGEIQDTPTFASILSDPSRAERLRAMGLEVPQPRPAPGFAPEVGPGVVRPEDLEDWGQRMDIAREQSSYETRLKKWKDAGKGSGRGIMPRNPGGWLYGVAPFALPAAAAGAAAAGGGLFGQGDQQPAPTSPFNLSNPGGLWQ